VRNGGAQVRGCVSRKTTVFSYLAVLIVLFRALLFFHGLSGFSRIEHNNSCEFSSSRTSRRPRANSISAWQRIGAHSANEGCAVRWFFEGGGGSRRSGRATGRACAMTWLHHTSHVASIHMSLSNDQGPQCPNGSPAKGTPGVALQCEGDSPGSFHVAGALPGEDAARYRCPRAAYGTKW